MEENKSSGNGNYRDIQNCPTLLASFIGKYVKIGLLKSMFYTGFINSIDPATYSIILTIYTQGSNQTVLIPGYAIDDIQEIKNESNITMPQKQSKESITAEELLKKKKKLISWFKYNMLPVTEDEDKIVFNNIKVLPPYTSTDISTYNPNVAFHIRRLIERMPDNYEPQ